MLILKFLLQFLQILNRGAAPWQISCGIALGAIVGLTPTVNLHNVAVLLVVLLLNVNLPSALLGWGVFGAFSILLDPLFHRVGLFFLTDVPMLTPLWTLLYNTPIVPWTRFNNTLVLGSLLMALLLFWPLFFFGIWGVKQYRERLMVAVAKWKIVQLLQTSRLYQLYQRYQKLS